ncbi:hypothetical protein B0H16DRAFT_1452190 [Mycena metata]|uniref:Uncharacterized protein n=1 Tax=Mycena metata TaxID=1033252 RepID=A0AAD7JST6_9AGAR|nr:hypothetical protein B0H16DRAFT_1452190 [Mycena metata]
MSLSLREPWGSLPPQPSRPPHVFCACISELFVSRRAPYPSNALRSQDASNGPLFHPHHVEAAVAKAILPVTRIRYILEQYGIREGLEGATDELLERFHHSGVVWLEVCFNHVMLVGHFSTIRKSVFSPKTFANGKSRHWARRTCHRYESGGGIGDFTRRTYSLWGPRIRFAVVHGDLLGRPRVFSDSTVAPHRHVEAGTVRRYKQALGVLLPDASTSGSNARKTVRRSLKRSAKTGSTVGSSATAAGPIPSQVAGPPTAQIKVEPRVVADSPEVDPAPRIRNAFGVLGRFVKREGQAFLNTAFPDGVLALAMPQEPSRLDLCRLQSYHEEQSGRLGSPTPLTLRMAKKILKHPAVAADSQTREYATPHRRRPPRATAAPSSCPLREGTTVRELLRLTAAAQAV